MHHAARMRLGQRMTDLPQQIHHALVRQRAELLHQRLEVAALEQLHHVIEAAVIGGAEVEQANRMLRLQQRRGLRFALEPAQLRLRRRIGVAERLVPDEFDRGSRASRRWRARHTAPIPPAPSCSTNS